MNKALLTLMTLACLTSYSTHEPRKLHSNKFCQTARFRCEPNAKHLVDDEGRCGCLTKEDYIDKETCLVATITCNSNKGEIYSDLYAFNKFVGCGCFATDR